jgi:hypothetical protein
MVEWILEWIHRRISCFVVHLSWSSEQKWKYSESDNEIVCPKQKMNNCPVHRIQEVEKKFQESLTVPKIDWYQYANLYNELIRVRHEVKQCIQPQKHVSISHR